MELQGNPEIWYSLSARESTQHIGFLHVGAIFGLQAYFLCFFRFSNSEFDKD